MKRLRGAGIRLPMIAELAGITTNGVRYRLRSKSQRNGSEYDPDRLYLAKQRARQQEYQRISLDHARNFGAWTPPEIRFLEKHAPELTLLELAIRLRRTYFSVSHFINRHGIETRK